MSSNNLNRVQSPNLSALTELFFVILPFIVIAIALLHKGALHTIFYLPEWSIVSAVMAGQSVKKLVSSVLGETVHEENVLFLLTIQLVCVLIPILVILSIVLTSDTVSLKQAWAQGILFVISAAIFFSLSLVETDAIP